MSEEIEVLKLVCQKLDQTGISYMITGSFAANFYAVPRMTRDLDIIIQINHHDGNKLFEIFQNDFYIERESIREAIDRQGMFNIIHNKTVFKIDFIIRKDTVYRVAEFQRRRELFLDNNSIWVVSPEDLIISKLYWAKDSLSEMQIKDINNILQSCQELDRKYIARWVKELSLDTIYKKAKIDE